MTIFNDREHSLGWLLQSFDPISLEGLNEKAEMLSRIDNKYVVCSNALQKMIPEIAIDFEILDIDHCRAFTYDTHYLYPRVYSHLVFV